MPFLSPPLPSSPKSGSAEPLPPGLQPVQHPPQSSSWAPSIKSHKASSTLCTSKLSYSPKGDLSADYWQEIMLSGRYRSCWLRRHWTHETGACRLPGCGMSPGDEAHILCDECPALSQTLTNVQEILSHHPLLLPPVHTALNSDKEALSTFILDPSTDPAVITLVQRQGRGILPPLFRVSRAWVWAAHRTRMRLLGLEKFLQ